MSASSAIDQDASMLSEDVIEDGFVVRDYKYAYASIVVWSDAASIEMTKSLCVYVCAYLAHLCREMSRRWRPHSGD